MGDYIDPRNSKLLNTSMNVVASFNKSRVVGDKDKVGESMSEGSCMAMCLVWFKRIFTSTYRSTAWEQSADGGAARLITTQYYLIQSTGDNMDREVQLFANQGMLHHGNTKDKNYKRYVANDGGLDAEDWIKMTPELTCFSIGITGHAMAGFWKKGAAYFFDPNRGVFEFGSINDFAVAVVDSIDTNYETNHFSFIRIEKG